MLNRVYRYRLYPNPNQEERLGWWLELQRQLWNMALIWRDGAWKYADEEERERLKTTNWRRLQTAELVELKKDRPEFRELPASTPETAIKKLDEAYRAAFKRLKAGEKPGFPKWKYPLDVNSFTVRRRREFVFEHDARDRFGFLSFRAFGLGRLGGDPLAVRMHRPLPALPGLAVRRVEIKRESAGRWFVCFGWDAPVTAREVRPDRVVALHPGLVDYMTSDSGEVFRAPSAWETYHAKLAAAQWRQSKKQRGSYRYRQEKQIVARWHAKIRAARRDFQHNLSRQIVDRYDRVIVNAHDVRRMLSKDDLRHLNVRVADAAWAEQCFMLQYKCETAGKDYVEVDSADTIDPCSRCGTLVHKTLRDREHTCFNCGLKISRGANAARNARNRVERSAAA